MTAISGSIVGKAASLNYLPLRPTPRRRQARDALIVLLVALGFVSINLRFREDISLRTIYTVKSNQRNVNTALVLDLLTTTDATVGLFWAGSIPYFADRRAIDMLGKTDSHIAHLPPDLSGSVARYGMKSLPGHNKYDLNYSIIELQPTYVQYFSWGNQDLTKWAETTYINVRCAGVSVSLLKESRDVIWSKIKKGRIYYCT
jgi:hypothetical protein